MPQVDFYILASSAPDAPARFGCRLAEKAYRLKHRVHIVVTDEAAEHRLDSLLWTFRDGSFVPHERLSELSGFAPVTVGSGERWPHDTELVINLSDASVGADNGVSRIAEIVSADPAARQTLRRRYAEYRDRGYELNSHDIG